VVTELQQLVKFVFTRDFSFRVRGFNVLTLPAVPRDCRYLVFFSNLLLYLLGNEALSQIIEFQEQRKLAALMATLVLDIRESQATKKESPVKLDHQSRPFQIPS